VPRVGIVSSDVLQDPRVEAFRDVLREPRSSGPVANSAGLWETEAAARTIGVTLQLLQVRHSDDLEQLFAAATRDRADAVLVFAHGFAFLNRVRINELAAHQSLPAMYGWREFIDRGGLMSYGPNVQAMCRHAATYVDRVLKGAKPGDLPIQQPTSFELIINPKTAKGIGVTIPQSLLQRADQVIE
jgi:putative tryptophan/tyrosine transport system substrate-binding protein